MDGPAVGSRRSGTGSGRWKQIPSGFSASLTQVEYARMLQQGSTAVPSTPMPAQQRRISVDEFSPAPGELSPGILDLHSLDTDLLSEMSVPDSGGDAGYFRRSDGSSRHQFSGADNKIKVVVRKRPLNRKEESKREEDIITIAAGSSSLTVHETKLKVDLTEYVEKHEFVFDAVLDHDVSNNEVYRQTVEPIVPAIFQRTKATCFAYGQTGSGKTYTMQPLPLKASQDILWLMNSTYRNQGFQLFVSFFEIYGGKLFDLLNDKRKLCMREDGKQQVCIVGLQEFRVSDLESIKELIERGNATRSTGTTGANEESSRSHAILQLAIKRLADDVKNSDKKPPRIVGKLSFIDLAGSERGADTTDNDKQTRIEGAEINKSLLALKECIRALDNDQVHIPFRGSKLTEVLRDSFIGNSRTVMISCVSPNSGSCEHTLNTLRYADRVKSLSKGSFRKDSSGLMGVRESCPAPPVLSSLDLNIPKFGPPKQNKKETFAPPNPSGIALDDLDLPDSDDELNVLLKEEEDMVASHREQIEETITILREEMKLLDEVDRPGSQVDEYIARLNTLLSKKVASVINLQSQLNQFQRHLAEQNILL